VTARGTVEGNIFVTELCELQAGCTLHGDIEAPRLVINQDVTFCGNAKVGAGKSHSAVEERHLKQTLETSKRLERRRRSQHFIQNLLGSSNSGWEQRF
jgi:cytoskeletal protein CcmA (bactofilin family)